MKMCRAGTERKAQSEVKRRRETKSMYVCLGDREWDRRWEKEREDEANEETWWVMWEQVWERAKEKKMKKRGSVGRWQAQTDHGTYFKAKQMGWNWIWLSVFAKLATSITFLSINIMSGTGRKCLHLEENVSKTQTQCTKRQRRNQTELILNEVDFNFPQCCAIIRSTQVAPDPFIQSSF